MSDMENEAINFKEKFRLFSEPWSPKVIAELNNYQFKLAKLRGEFIWHKHEDTDEAFIVIKGQMKIMFRNGQVNLSAGEMYIVPQGIEHKPCADRECQVLIIEPRNVPNTGNIKNELTSPKDNWI